MAEAERECEPMYDDARRPSCGVKTMGEFRVERLKSYEEVDTGEVRVLCALWMF